MFIIYGLFDASKPDEIRYVGKTRQQPTVRFVCHLSRSLRERDTHKARWIHRTLAEGGHVDMRVLTTTDTLEEANRLERLHIKMLREAGAKLTNETDGGDGGLGHKVSDIHRKIISERHRNRPKPPDQRAKISAALKGRPCPEMTKDKLRHHAPSEMALRNLAFGRAIGQEKGRPKSTEHREKLRLANIGKHLSDETKRKISLTLEGRPSPMKGRILSPNHRQKISNAMRGRIYSAETRAKIGAANKRRALSKACFPTATAGASLCESS